MKHSHLGASSSHRWMSCPGSVRMSKDIASVSSPYALEGTAAHALVEWGLQTDLKVASRVGGTILADHPEIVVSEEMAEAAQIYIDCVRGALAGASPLSVLHVEKQFDLGWLGQSEMYGTNDAMIMEPFGKLIVFDFKFGAGVPVEVRDNSQMKYYSLGAINSMPFEEVEMVIVQPRCIHPDGPIRRATISPDELIYWGKSALMDAAKATTDPNAPLRSGNHCRFCPARPICPEQRNQANLVARDVFTPKPKALPNPEALSQADLRDVLHKADMLESWLDSCRAHARMLLDTGAATEDLGHKLVTGRASRSWADDGKAEEFLCEALAGEAYVRKMISPAQAEKALGKKNVPKDLINEVRGAQMVPVSDKREAIAPPSNPALIFSKFEVKE